MLFLLGEDSAHPKKSSNQLQLPCFIALKIVCRVLGPTFHTLLDQMDLDSVTALHVNERSSGRWRSPQSRLGGQLVTASQLSSKLLQGGYIMNVGD